MRVFWIRGISVAVLVRARYVTTRTGTRDFRRSAHVAFWVGFAGARSGICGVRQMAVLIIARFVSTRALARDFLRSGLIAFRIGGARAWAHIDAKLAVRARIGATRTSSSRSGGRPIRVAGGWPRVGFASSRSGLCGVRQMAVLICARFVSTRAWARDFRRSGLIAFRVVGALGAIDAKLALRTRIGAARTFFSGGAGHVAVRWFLGILAFIGRVRPTVLPLSAHITRRRPMARAAAARSGALSGHVTRNLPLGAVEEQDDDEKQQHRRRNSRRLRHIQSRQSRTPASTGKQLMEEEGGEFSRGSRFQPLSRTGKSVPRAH